MINQPIEFAFGKQAYYFTEKILLWARLVSMNF
jgi:hypothetical protein